MKKSNRLLITTLVVINIFFAKNILLSATTTLNLKCYLEGFYKSSSNQMSKSFPITVLLHNSISPYSTVSINTSVLDINGNALSINFNIPSNGAYYIEVKNWNMLQTWSAGPQSFTISGTTNYDFSVAVNRAFGDNMKQVDDSPSRWGIYGGDINQDSIIDPYDLVVTDNEVYNYTTGNIVTDLTGDETIDLDDLIILNNNVFNFIAVVKP